MINMIIKNIENYNDIEQYHRFSVLILYFMGYFLSLSLRDIDVDRYLIFVQGDMCMCFAGWVYCALRLKTKDKCDNYIYITHVIASE